MLLLNTLVLFSISGFSTKYYVDVAGNNSNNGSSTSPWKTLAYACTTVTTPGDIIHLNGGTFNESSRSNLAVGVSIEGSGIDVTVINSSYVASNSSDGAIRLNSSTYTNGDQSISNLTFTGNNLTATRGICINYRNNVSINNCKIANFYASAIFFRGSNVAWDAEPNPYCTGNKIFNTTVNSCATRSSGESASIRINGQSGFLLYDNTFNQTFRPAGQNGNILGGEWNKGLKIYNNTFTKPDNEGSAWNFFFELWHWQGGGEIYNNTFNGAATMDIVDVVKSTSDYGLKIHDNKYLVKSVVPFTANQIQSINLEGRSHLDDIEIYNNYLKNVPNGIWVDVVVNEGEGYSSFAVNNLSIHHNIMENVGMTDVNTIPIWMNAYGSNGNISFNNIQVNNNTIQCSNNVKGLNAIKWNVIGKFSNIFVQNNIFTNNKDDVMSFSSSLSGATLTNVTIKNNLYYNNGANAPKYNMTVSNKVESGNIVENPLFVSSTDLNLQTNSPAINAGVNIGYSFNGTAPEIGAYETGSTGTTADATKPVISSFTIPATATTLNIPISTLTATDNIGVKNYLVTESATTPTTSTSGWTSTKPASYNFSSGGTKTLYAWVNDAAGNISTSASTTTTINLPVASTTSNTYYLSPNGDDTNGNGSVNSPWFSLNKVWSVVKAGDVVYMKGGTYLYKTTQSLRGKSGASGNLIKVWAMPGEQPVISPAGEYTGTRGIDIYGNYIHFKGLEIKDYKQKSSTALYYGIVAENSNNIIFETLKVHDNGFGLSIGSDSGDNLVLNSDFYRNSDPLSSFGTNVPWGGADGVTIRSSNLSKTNTIRGCRMWWNSDDGVDLFNNEGLVVIENSWSFWNGYQPGTFTAAGNGDGFKVGVTLTDQSSSVKRILRNNVAFENRMIGFDQNNARCITQLFNNTSYNNANLGTAARSFNFWNGTAATVAKNNLDFKQSMSALFNSQAIVSNNSFLKTGTVNTAYTVSSADFLSLDKTGVDGPRQNDGTLPNLNFLKLAPGSDLINKGTNVGLSYSGTAPDLGAFESNYSADVTAPVVTAFAVPSSSGSLTVPVSTFTATDNVGVTGYLLSQTATTPSVSSTAWRSSKPTSYTFSSSGLKTLYAWVKDAAGNISSPLSDGITITVSLLTVNPDASQDNMHFASIAQGSSSDGMNIELTGIKEGALAEGDELALFDGNTCVSSVKLVASDISNGYVSLIAPVGTNNQDGFTNGNTIQIMSWNAKSGVESQLQAEATSGKMIFESQSNAVIQLKFQTTGVADIIKSVKIDVYPNPCTDHMTVRYSEVPAFGSKVQIIDNTGKVVDSREITNTQESFNLNQMPNGLYLVKSIIGSSEVVNKLIINK
ncbi:MAG TPA: T9SS type A sorting domain-containing protein [Ignavibacteriaceae bacterium]|nr:T9SS type A sorting domain-containing protein [Ignavibacteriaceae bacterium]